MTTATSKESWLVGTIDPHRHIKVALKSEEKQNQLLLSITVVENGKAYRHDELVSLGNLDYFIVVHLSGWLARNFQVQVDRILYERLKQSKFFTKQMLRDDDIFRNVKIT